MPILETDQGAIHYEVAGEGPPLVMLRGLGRSMRHWLGYEQEVAKHFQVITLDLRGIGQSNRPSRMTTTIYDMADDVVAVLDHLKIERAHVLGVSLGGMVTLAAGIRHASRCSSLVVVNTSIGGQLTLRLSPTAVRGMLRSVFAKGEERHRSLVDNLIGHLAPKARREEVTRRYHAIEENEGSYINTVVRQLVSAVRFRPQRELKGLTVPTLIIYGTHDTFVPVVNSIKLAKLLPHARLFPLKDAGHEPSLDQGEALTAAVRDWVQSQK